MVVFAPLQLHPVEVARQLTLIEFELYRYAPLASAVGTPVCRQTC